MVHCSFAVEFRKSSVFFVALFLGVLFCSFSSSTFAQNNKNKKFVVVLDAGHGGKDPGNQGNGFSEKNIALQIVLKIGKELEKHNDIKVVYTRSSDVFVPLIDRAEKANHIDADLFVSIHLNAFRNGGPHGTETYVLGTYRNKDNLDIAMKENSVIYLEDNYEETYDGFDPKSPASYIGMTLMQEEYLDQSIVLADFVQKEFVSQLKRYNRGVKKAGFLVLRETYMPSILIETGFLTNLAEGRYLNSAGGQQGMAKAITEGVMRYKKTLNLNEIAESLADADVSGENNPIFKVQIATSHRHLETLPQNFKGLKNIERKKEGDIYRYYYGAATTKNQAEDFLKEAKKVGYSDAFLIKVEDRQKTSLK